MAVRCNTSDLFSHPLPSKTQAGITDTDTTDTAYKSSVERLSIDLGVGEVPLFEHQHTYL